MARGKAGDGHGDGVAGRGPPPCPFCGSDDPNCGHLVVAADRTFMEFSGTDFERYVGPAEDLLRRAVPLCLAHLARLPKDRRDALLAAVEPPRLRGLLADLAAAWPALAEDELGTIPWDRPRWDYLGEILLSAGDTVERTWAFDGGSGPSSERADFWSSRPSAAAREARRLILADVAALDRLLA